MKKVVALIAAAVVALGAPPYVSRHGLAYELRDVPTERHAFVMDVTFTGWKYAVVEFLSVPLAAALLILAAAVYFGRRVRPRW